MKKLKAVSFILLLCVLGTFLSACGGETVWFSPMMSVSLQSSQLSVYNNFELADLNSGSVSPSALLESNAVTLATLNFAYNGDKEYKARINVRIDEVEVENGFIGHNVAVYGVSKTHVAVLFYADDTWFDGAYGSNVASGGDTLFDSRFYAEDDAEFSETRRAFPLNKETSQSLNSLAFYIVGLVDGYYILNFYVEEADLHGHFHGLNKLALTSVLVTVGTPTSSVGEA